MNYRRSEIQEYFYGSPHRIAEKILVIHGTRRLNEYAQYLQDIECFGRVWQGISGIFRGENITIIAGGIGASQVGDAVYALDQPNAICIFSGTCGGIDQNIDIGDYFLATHAICGDGYGLLFGYQPFDAVSPHQPVLSRLQQAFHQLNISYKSGAVFSTGSVLRETEADFWKLVHPACKAIDMECAAFYLAARHSQKLAAAYFWVTDLPNDGKSFFDTLSVEEKARKQERYDGIIETNLHILSNI